MKKLYCILYILFFTLIQSGTAAGFSGNCIKGQPDTLAVIMARDTVRKKGFFKKL